MENYRTVQVTYATAKPNRFTEYATTYDAVNAILHIVENGVLEGWTFGVDRNWEYPTLRGANKHNDTCVLVSLLPTEEDIYHASKTDQ